MGWVIWHDNDGGPRVYIRRITPQFVAYTMDPLAARKWPTRKEAAAAAKEATGKRHRVVEAPADPPAGQ